MAKTQDKTKNCLLFLRLAFAKMSGIFRSRGQSNSPAAIKWVTEKEKSKNLDTKLAR